MRVVTTIRQIIIGLATLSLSAAAFAAEEGTFFGQRAQGKWMIGVKVAKVDNGAADFDDATNAGVLLGYEFNRPIGFDGSASLEVEWTTTTSDGDIGPQSDFGVPGRWEGDIVALFFAYRTPGTVYFKAKLGGQYSDLDYKIGPGSSNVDDFSFAFGAGLGFKIGEVGKIEVEYTGDTGDNDLNIWSLGGILLF